MYYYLIEKQGVGNIFYYENRLKTAALKDIECKHFLIDEKVYDFSKDYWIEKS
jgi:hypothetical protein